MEGHIAYSGKNETGYDGVSPRFTQFKVRAIPPANKCFQTTAFGALVRNAAQSKPGAQDRLEVFPDSCAVRSKRAAFKVGFRQRNPTGG